MCFGIRSTRSPRLSIVLHGRGGGEGRAGLYYNWAVLLRELYIMHSSLSVSLLPLLLLLPGNRWELQLEGVVRWQDELPAVLGGVA